MARPRKLLSVAAMTSTPFRVLVAAGGVAGVEAPPTLPAIAGDQTDLRCELDAATH